jgi:branched-chain amino acid transport system ATP-binding protein
MMMDSGPSKILELNGVDASYGHARILRAIELSVRERAVVALLGANGAGKTTLLRIASGLLRPTTGEVRLAGKVVTRNPSHVRARGGLCHITEGRSIFRSLSVRDNLELAIPPWSKHSEFDRATTVFPKLADRLRQTAGSLSGGEQQMLALARAFLSDPAVVLVDELSMGLAPVVVDELFEALERLAASGVAILLVEQYVTRAIAMADYVYLMSKGQITFSGPASEVDQDEVMRTYLGASV